MSELDLMDELLDKDIKAKLAIMEDEKYPMVGYLGFFGTIVGATYRSERARYLLQQAPDYARVRLIREPTNPHDRMAVKILLDTAEEGDIHVGYLPKEQAPAVSRLIKDLRKGGLCGFIAPSTSRTNYVRILGIVEGDEITRDEMSKLKIEGIRLNAFRQEAYQIAFKDNRFYKQGY